MSIRFCYYFFEKYGHPSQKLKSSSHFFRVVKQFAKLFYSEV
ncbi:Uncharacterized protein dnm_005240 [Desulfonema magnum]|uniref:Uncharacterized protein n=1 Tax=Desulfonema magnum TaxID=45655 RepID=A0A975BFV1_9BACT|nr:Uncharacterized protein dnm_005240 [Desulfonema magnum]